MGVDVKDIDFRPLIQFKRPGCDESVTKLLFEKNEAKREKLINEIIAFRERLIPKLREPPGESPIVRVERAFVEQEKKKLEEMKQQRDLDLQKLVVQKLRDLFELQFHQAAVDRTISRATQIEQMREATMRAAWQKAIPSLPSGQEPVPWPGPYVELDDVHLTHLIQLRKDQEVHRLQKAKIKSEQHRMICERALKVLTEQLGNRQQKIEGENGRFERWLGVHNEAEEQRNQRARDRKLHEQAVLESVAKADEEKRQQALTRAQEKEQKSMVQTERMNQNTQDRLSTMRTRIESRAQKALDCRERIAQHKDELRTLMDKRDDDFKEKEKQHELETTLKYLGRQLDRDEKIERVRRMPLAHGYTAELQLRKRHEDILAANGWSQERMKLGSQRSSENARYMEKKERLLAEIAQLKDPTDPKGLQRIRQILQLEEDEMERLVNSAKSGVGTYSRPPTGLTSRSAAPSELSKALH
jgi:hypothetical protein